MSQARLTVGLLSLLGVSIAVGTPAAAQVPKEGVIATTATYTGRAHVTYEALGVVIGDSEQELLHRASARCLGAYHIVKGEYDSDSGFCAYIRLDGDQAFARYQGSGKQGVGARGTFTYVGGPGSSPV